MRREFRWSFWPINYKIEFPRGFIKIVTFSTFLSWLRFHYALKMSQTYRFPARKLKLTHLKRKEIQPLDKNVCYIRRIKKTRSHKFHENVWWDKVRCRHVTNLAWNFSFPFNQDATLDAEIHLLFIQNTILSLSISRNNKPSISEYAPFSKPFKVLKIGLQNFEIIFHQKKYIPMNFRKTLSKKKVA